MKDIDKSWKYVLPKNARGLVLHAIGLQCARMRPYCTTVNPQPMQSKPNMEGISVRSHHECTRVDREEKMGLRSQGLYAFVIAF